MEESLVFLKPDAVLRKSIGAAILQEFLNKKEFSILAFKEIVVSEDLAKKHYKEHEKKHFFPWLVKAVRAAPVLAMIVQGEIKKIRDFLGATFVQKAEPQSIRGKYGIWGGVNSVHASDSVETGLRELELWKKIANLEKDPDAVKKIKEYIEKWGSSKENNTLKLRNLCKKLTENPELKNQVYQDLIPLLKEDCPEANLNAIQNFAAIIIENVLL
ncbi:MAG: nucleoside-diphosphate kinase [Candidatus Helarchaeota archaeon]